MSPERTHAYRRVLHTIDELGPTKLQSAEQDLIRYAADNLILCVEIDDDPAVRESLEEAEALLEGLVESGRWEHVTAERLSEDLRACGPNLRPLSLEPAV